MSKLVIFLENVIRSGRQYVTQVSRRKEMTTKHHEKI